MKIYFVAVLALVALMSVARQSEAQDGAMIVRDMEAAYSRLQSYSQRTTVTAVRSGPAGTATEGGSWELRFRRPNRFYVRGESPGTGVFVAVCDGRQMLVYQGSVNAYRRLPVPATAHDFVKALFAFGIKVVFDPLAFIGGDKVERTLNPIKTAGSAEVGGAACYVVRGDFRAKVAPKPSRAEFTFWIDKESKLLRKVERDVAVVGSVRQTGRGKTKHLRPGTPVEVRLDLSVLVQAIQVNPPLADSAFAYTPPKGAVEQNPEKLFHK